MEQTLTESQSQEQYIMGGNNLTQNKAHIPLCRDNFRGTCANGASCKYQHVDAGKRNGARGLGNSQLHKTNDDYDSRTRFTNRGHRSKSPCRDFLRGTCLFGSKCRRLHPVNIEGHQDVTLRASQYHTKSNMDNPLRIGNIPGNFNMRLPCRDFFSGKCYRGESCSNLHSFLRYDRTRCLGRTEKRGVQATYGTSHFNDGDVGPTSRMYQNCNGQKNDARSTKDGLELTSNRENMDITSRAEFIREPEVCLMFNKGMCNFGDSCLYLHCYHKNDMKLNNVGQNGQKCQLPEEKSEGIFSRPFKRQRIQSKSPLTSENDIHCMNLRSFDSQVDLHRDGCYNLVSFQFPGHCSNTFERPIYHANSYEISKQQENGYIIETIKKNVEPTLAMTEVSRRKLLVLDVNGILADIVAEYPRCCKPGITLSKQGVFKRPFCDEFLQFCFERYDVGIWSSRTKKNVAKVVNFLLKDNQNRLLFCWDQSHCTATGYKTLENENKPLVLKELENLWDNKWGNLPWKKGYYNETNTVLLDDSPYKALRNPPYTAVFPHPYTLFNKEDKALGPGGDVRVYLEKLAEAENVQKFLQENPFGQSPITQSSSSWAFYAKIVGP